MAKLRIAELEALYTANTVGIDKAEKKVQDSAQRIESTPIEQKIEGNPTAALADIDRVTAGAKKLVSERAVLQLDTDISRAEKNLQRARDKVEDLSIRAEAGFEVTAETKRAVAAVERLEQQAERLKAVRATVEPEVNTDPAESGMKRFLAFFKRTTGEAGTEGGKSLSEGLDSATRGAGEKVGAVVGGDIEGTLVNALTAIPIAGGIILAGVAIGKAITGAIEDGMAVEVGFDRLEALTGLSPQQAMRIGRAAGEAYANVFGDSIEANMDTARLAVQFDLIDENATTRTAQKVVQGLAGIADVLGEDVRPVAEATTTLLRTGLAKSADDAFDIIAAGARNGLNRSEDLLDTFTEYPVVLRKLGLDGKDALGLINQGLVAGARNTDVVADALKEFQIRATDASDASADGYKRIGLNAEEMTAKIAAGGEGAREGLQQVLDALRATEDPVQRNAAAVELFGTKAEDLGDALFALDLTSAVDQLDGVTGSAQRMFETLSDNDATRMEQAKRNIEVAAQGIQGALAQAFAEPLADFAEWISSNRGPLLQFFADLGNGALDFGQSVVDSTADAGEAIGELVAGPLADAVKGLARFVGFFDKDAGEGLDELVDKMREADTATEKWADRLRTSGGAAIDEARQKFNDFIDPQIDQGFLNDATMRLAEAVDAVGVAASNGAPLLSDFRLAADGTGSATAELDFQMRKAIDAMREEQDAAVAASEEQANLEQRHKDATLALANQLTQMGLTSDQAWALIKTYESIPPTVSTTISADTSMAYDKLMSLQEKLREITGDHRLKIATGPGGQGGLVLGNGGIVEYMAQGGIRGVTPMDPVAQTVPASTWRIVGDRSDVAEAFIPIDGSPRSTAVLLDTMRRFGFGEAAPSTSGQPQVVNHNSISATFQQTDERLQMLALGRVFKGVTGS
ncbi:phage tail tape measure protein [Microbacterium sp. BG28]|uniref:phage tail tape measure protein n=1 Tax=Microbacterium sp. BG28 TaxID=3097356 RepID=UPI002A59DDBE|nr:phage tail tape measure protein [Microbacterium sp. BG28]MDY0830732.1 phage tail tape measure protein [Microbacterium sp. BG28]